MISDGAQCLGGSWRFPIMISQTLGGICVFITELGRGLLVCLDGRSHVCALMLPQCLGGFWGLIDVLER